MVAKKNSISVEIMDQVTVSCVILKGINLGLSIKAKLELSLLIS
jgi:hypothetical protein